MYVGYCLVMKFNMQIHACLNRVICGRTLLVDEEDDPEVAAHKISKELADETPPFLSAFKYRPTIGALMTSPDAVEQAFAVACVKEIKGGVKVAFEALDIDKNGTLSGEEFLICMRKVREHEMKKIRNLFASADEDNSGTISRAELPKAVQSLGYVADPEAVWEAATEAHIDPNQEDLDFGELWRLLTIYRAREGFLRSESEDIAEAFKRIDKAKVGEIGVVEVGRTLRLLGYPINFEAMQQLVAQVDIDGSGKVSLPELRKFVRLYQGRELIEAREAFSEFDTLKEGNLARLEYEEAMKSIGCVDSRGMPAEPAPRDLMKPRTPKGFSDPAE